MSSEPVLAVESRRGRRIVGVLQRGQDLVTAIENLCRARNVRTAELRGLGSLERVEFAEYDQAQRKWKPARCYDGGFEILNLTGNVSERDGRIAVHTHATVMRDRDTGIEVLGGHVVSARIFALEFVLEVFDDLLLRRGVDPATGLTLWREAITLDDDAAQAAGASGAASGTVTSWQQVAAASERVAASAKARAAEAPEEIILGSGDLLLHPRLGRCEVLHIEGDQEFAQIKLSTGRLVRIALDVLQLRASGHEGTNRVIRAHVG